jgi:hypothetical protein
MTIPDELTESLAEAKAQRHAKDCLSGAQTMWRKKHKKERFNEPSLGIEPRTSALQVRCSTTKLRRQIDENSPKQLMIEIFAEICQKIHFLFPEITIAESIGLFPFLLLLQKSHITRPHLFSRYTDSGYLPLAPSQNSLVHRLHPTGDHYLKHPVLW